MTRTVLFLCTGNYYRSRLAEILFDAEAARLGLPWRAESRGLALERGANNVGPLSADARRWLERLGVAFDGYLRMPRGTEDAHLQSADLIVALKGEEHRPLMRERHPEWEAKVEYWEIHDNDCLPPDEAMPMIEARVRELAARLATGERPAG